MNIRRNPGKLLALALLLAVTLVLWVSAGQDETEGDGAIGRKFLYETSLTWQGAIGDLFSAMPAKPPQFKKYTGARTVKLPPAEFKGLAVEEAIRRRRSARKFSDRPLKLEELSQLLWAAQGVTGERFRKLLRTAPSAGALYPFEVYVFVNNVEGLERGLYHYGVREHQLEQVKAGDFRAAVTEAGLDQDMLGAADATFALAAVIDRIRFKYGERGWRYIFMESGHISQNIYLQAASMGLGSVAVGAFLDKKLNELLGLDGVNEAAIALHAVGTL